MATPLHVLILEDNPSDAYLMLHALERAGFEARANLVETLQEFRKHLEQAPDVVIADFNLPQLSALDALRVLEESALDIPCIVVSGKMSDECVAALLQHGAVQCIKKQDFERLGPAIRQALQRKASAPGIARCTKVGDPPALTNRPVRWRRTLASIQRLLS